MAQRAGDCRKEPGQQTKSKQIQLVRTANRCATLLWVLKQQHLRNNTCAAAPVGRLPHMRVAAKSRRQSIP
eukprot:3497931-Amphidinium_carterae.1